MSFLGKFFFEFSYLMKAEYLFAWHIEIIPYILKYQKTVFFIHPSLFLYSSALPNERMKAPFRFSPFICIVQNWESFLCLTLYKVGLSFILSDILENLYIIVYRKDFLKRIKDHSFIYTYYIGVVCEASVSFHAQCL